MNTNRRTFCGTVAAAFPSSLVVGWSQTPPRASPHKDQIYHGIIEGLMRNHQDERQRGPHGEHARTTANYLRLLIAHGQNGNLDAVAAEAVSRKGGTTTFVDFDFVTFGRSMIASHLNENPPSWLYDPSLDQPSRARVDKFTNLVLTEQLTTFMGRIARALDYHGAKLDQHIRQQG